MELLVRIELTTFSLRVRCSAIEPQKRFNSEQYSTLSPPCQGSPRKIHGNQFWCHKCRRWQLRSALVSTPLPLRGIPPCDSHGRNAAIAHCTPRIMVLPFGARQYQGGRDEVVLCPKRSLLASPDKGRWHGVAVTEGVSLSPSVRTGAAPSEREPMIKKKGPRHAYPS